MRIFCGWILCALLAFAIQSGIDWVLPAEASRPALILAGGMGMLAWSSLYDFIMAKCDLDQRAK